MVNSFVLKSVVGVGGAASVATGVGFFVWRGLPSPKEKETLISLLSKDPSRRLISGRETEAWDNTWKEYKFGEDIWNLGNEESVPEPFKTACKNKLNLKVGSRNDREYKDFSLYCTRGIMISDLIKENNSNKELIASTNGSDSAWVTVWKAYISDNRNKDKSDTDHIWGLSDWSSQHSQESTAPASFMNKCKDNVKVNSYDINGSLYLSTLEFCTKDK